MEDILFTMEETAAILKSNVAYVQELRKSGLLKVLKLGRYKVRKTELERFLKTYEGFDLTDPYNIKKLE